MKKFKVATLGCRTNQYESQAYKDQLKQLGMEAASDQEVAELCIVNTCSVTRNADRDSEATIKRLAKENPGARLVITGCSAQQHPTLRQLDGVTDLVFNADKENLVATLFPDLEMPPFLIKEFEAHTRAFVKVQDGCDSFCTYCTIPYMRGRSRSRSIEDVILEVKQLIDTGFKEIVLTGINIGDFDGNGSGKLVDLVKAVDQLSGLQRLRLSSIDPDEVDEELADALLQGKTTCPSMHIVLQSGSNAILKRMNRKYTQQIFLQTVERLKAMNPDFTFTTDVIVGFPGETEEDFIQTLQMIDRVKFAKVHMFPYSDRPKVRSALFPGKVLASVMQERKSRVLRQAEESSFALRQQFVGKRVDVLVESSSLEKTSKGHTVHFLPVTIDTPYPAGTVVSVILEENQADGLYARAVI